MDCHRCRSNNLEIFWDKRRFVQVMQVAYGVATSTEVAYFTYIYAKISGEHYRLVGAHFCGKRYWNMDLQLELQVTSWTRASLLLGRFLSGTISQVLICMCWTDYRGLNYISLTLVSCATCVSFFLPSVQSAIYFHRQVSSNQQCKKIISYYTHFRLIHLLHSLSQNSLNQCS